MKRLVTILLLITLVTGCTSSNSSPNTATSTNVTTETSITETSTATSSNVPISVTTVELTTETSYASEINTIDMEQMEISQLFETVYLPYANREKSFIFDAVKLFALSTEYNVEITEPTLEDVGEIKIEDENNDYVYFAFNLVNNVEAIMIVSYYQASTNSEVSLSNFSTDGSKQYDIYETHVLGESSIEVSGPDEQQRFLFN